MWLRTLITVQLVIGTFAELGYLAPCVCQSYQCYGSGENEDKDDPIDVDDENDCDVEADQMDDSELAADSAQAVLVSASARCSARLFTPIVVINLIISMSIVVVNTVIFSSKWLHKYKEP